MRSLFILIAAGAGAWFMAQASISFGSSLAQGGGGAAALGGLLIAPAVLLGAAGGALLGGLLSPWAR